MNDLRLVTTFNNSKMLPDANLFRVATTGMKISDILKHDAAAGLGAIDPNDETHKKYGVTLKTILESIAEQYNMDDAVVPLNIDTMEVELPEAGAIKGFHGIKPLQETALTKLEVVMKKFAVLKDVLYVADPEETQLTQSSFKSRYDALTVIEAGKEISRLKTKTIIDHMNQLDSSQTLTASANQKWDAATGDPYDIIFDARAKIKAADEGEGNMILANTKTWSKFLKHKDVKGLAYGVNYPDFNQTFPVPGMVRLRGKVNDFLLDGEAVVENTSRFMVSLQSYAWIEQARVIGIGADVLRFVNFQNAGIWHSKAGVKLKGLLN
ncbi:MAG: major capsid protein [Candidatus Bathyarchaeota archaeon]|nr:major capsid protein [Candidatus Termitimicrobium sp.]